MKNGMDRNAQAKGAARMLLPPPTTPSLLPVQSAHSAASSSGTLSRRAPPGTDRRRPGPERLLRPKRQPSNTLQIRDASATDWGIIAASTRAPRDMLMDKREKGNEENHGHAQHSPSSSSARSPAPTGSSDAASRRDVGVASEFIPVLRPRF
jgi:hypothetical protein